MASSRDCVEIAYATFGAGDDTLIGGAGSDTCAAGKGDVLVRCGKGPPCQAGAYSSPPQAITVPPTGQSRGLKFATSIPNYNYYRRHGFDSGGCDHENGKMVANIEVLGGGSPVAWTYQYPPGGGGTQVHSGNYCPAPGPPDGDVRDHCLIFRPELAFMGPDASQEKTYIMGRFSNPRLHLELRTVLRRNR